MEFPKIAIVVPFFGKFNNYFPLWLRSCGNNPSFTWIIFTDDKSRYSFPSNVLVHYCNQADIDLLIKQTLGEDISLIRPHKLCDFKVLYGTIFSNWLKDYDYWGYCDVDVIFGDLKKFITIERLTENKKIFSLGHLSIIPNTNEINESIKKFSLSSDVKEQILLNPHTTLFDEWYGTINVNQLFVSNQWTISEDEGEISDVYVGSSDFLLTRWNPITDWFQVFKGPCLFQWSEDFGLLRYQLIDNNIQVSDSCYIHLKERQMEVHNLSSQKRLENAPVVGIFPHGLYLFEEKQDIDSTWFTRYNEGFFRFIQRRGKKRWRNGIYRIKLKLGFFKHQRLTK